MHTLLLHFLIIGFFAAGLTHTLRAVAPQAWLLNKPWSCDLCMSWWGSWFGAILIGISDPMAFNRALAAVLAGTGLSVLLVRASNRLSQ